MALTGRIKGSGTFLTPLPPYAELTKAQGRGTPLRTRLIVHFTVKEHTDE